MEADVEGLIGAGRYERNVSAAPGAAFEIAARKRGSVRCSSVSRNCGGAAISRSSSKHARAQKALVAVIQEAWIGGVSTRRLHDLVQAMELCGISKSQVPSSARTFMSG